MQKLLNQIYVLKEKAKKISGAKQMKDKSRVTFIFFYSSRWREVAAQCDLKEQQLTLIPHIESDLKGAAHGL